MSSYKKEDQEYGAKFASFQGKVYPFDRDLDVKKVEYQPNLPTYCTVDFGYRMPAVLFIQTYRNNPIMCGLQHLFHHPAT